MLQPFQILEIERLLAAGKPRAAIRRQFHLPRSTLARIALRWQRAGCRVPPPREEDYPTCGPAVCDLTSCGPPPTRCPGCGGLVFTPCQLCALRRKLRRG